MFEGIASLCKSPKCVQLDFASIRSPVATVVKLDYLALHRAVLGCVGLTPEGHCQHFQKLILEIGDQHFA